MSTSDLDESLTNELSEVVVLLLVESLHSNMQITESLGKDFRSSLEVTLLHVLKDLVVFAPLAVIRHAVGKNLSHLGSELLEKESTDDALFPILLLPGILEAVDVLVQKHGGLVALVDADEELLQIEVTNLCASQETLDDLSPSGFLRVVQSSDMLGLLVEVLHHLGKVSTSRNEVLFLVVIHEGLSLVVIDSSQ